MNMFRIFETNKIKKYHVCTYQKMNYLSTEKDTTLGNLSVRLKNELYLQNT